MKQSIILVLVLQFLFILSGCADKDTKRINELEALPELWKSKLLVSNPEFPDDDFIIPMQDSYDPNMLEFLSDTQEKTEDHIPESVMAFAVKMYNNKPRVITIRIGDTVSVLSEVRNNSSIPVYLIRTEQNTYAWIYAYHIQDRDGNRVKRI